MQRRKEHAFHLSPGFPSLFILCPEHTHDATGIRASRQELRFTNPCHFRARGGPQQQMQRGPAEGAAMAAPLAPTEPAPPASQVAVQQEQQQASAPKKVVGSVSEPQQAKQQQPAASSAPPAPTDPKAKGVRRCPACNAAPLTEEEKQVVRKPGRRSTRDPNDPRNRDQNLVTPEFLQKHIVEAAMSLRDIGSFHGYTISTLSRQAKKFGIAVGLRAKAGEQEEGKPAAAKEKPPARSPAGTPQRRRQPQGKQQGSPAKRKQPSQQAPGADGKAPPAAAGAAAGGAPSAAGAAGAAEPAAGAGAASAAGAAAAAKAAGQTAALAAAGAPAESAASEDGRAAKRQRRAGDKAPVQPVQPAQQVQHPQLMAPIIVPLPPEVAAAAAAAAAAGISGLLPVHRAAKMFNIHPAAAMLQAHQLAQLWHPQPATQEPATWNAAQHGSVGALEATRALLQAGADSGSAPPPPKQSQLKQRSPARKPPIVKAAQRAPANVGRPQTDSPVPLRRLAGKRRAQRPLAQDAAQPSGMEVDSDGDDHDAIAGLVSLRHASVEPSGGVPPSAAVTTAGTPAGPTSSTATVGGADAAPAAALAAEAACQADAGAGGSAGSAHAVHAVVKAEDAPMQQQQEQQQEPAGMEVEAVQPKEEAALQAAHVGQQQQGQPGPDTLHKHEQQQGPVVPSKQQQPALLRQGGHSGDAEHAEQEQRSGGSHGTALPVALQAPVHATPGGILVGSQQGEAPDVHAVVEGSQEEQQQGAVPPLVGTQQSACGAPEWPFHSAHPQQQQPSLAEQRPGEGQPAQPAGQREPERPQGLASEPAEEQQAQSRGDPQPKQQGQHAPQPGAEEQQGQQPGEEQQPAQPQPDDVPPRAQQPLQARQGVPAMQDEPPQLGQAQQQQQQQNGQHVQPQAGAADQPGRQPAGAQSLCTQPGKQQQNGVPGAPEAEAVNGGAVSAAPAAALSAVPAGLERVCMQAALHVLETAVASFEAADMASPDSMLRPLRRLALAGQGGPTLQSIVSGWDGYPPAKQRNIFCAALLASSQAQWQQLEADLKHSLQMA